MCLVGVTVFLVGCDDCSCGVLQCVLWGVTVCLSGHAAMVTSENTSLLRDSVGIYRTDFDYPASLNAVWS